MNTIETSVLTRIDTIEIELPFDLNPRDFYRDREGLWVCGGFDGGDVIRNARPLLAGTKFRLNRWKITAERGATDAQIEAALGQNHHFDATTICGIYAAMMTKQWNGEEGYLLTDDYTTLAYLGGCVAVVDWYVDFGSWFACTWGRDICRWSQGPHQVLSPAV